MEIESKGWVSFYRAMGIVAVILCACGVVPAQAPTAAATSTAAANPAAANDSLAEKVNDRLPDWVRFGGEYRLRVEGVTGIGGRREVDDAYVLSRLRLDLTFTLGKHWRIFVQGQDSQVGGINARPVPAIHEDDFDLRQAYVEVRQAEASGWFFRVGRQELLYGDQRLVGPLNWTNTGRVFDAAKLGYVDKRVAVDVFASSVVVNQDNRFDRHFDGQNFYGAHASFLKAIPSAQLDAYVFWKTAPRVIGEFARVGDADTWTFGGRLNGKAPKYIDYTVEVAGQRGSFASDDIRAAAAHGRLGATFSKRVVVPKLRLEYNYASGDASPADNVRGTFDQLYPTGHDKYGIIDQVGWKNLHNARIGTSFKPHSRVTVAVDYNSFWLAHRRDGLYDAGSNLVARIASGAPDAHVAQEIDLQTSVSLTKRVTFDVGFGHWFPGAFWKTATPGAARNFAFSSVVYKF